MDLPFGALPGFPIDVDRDLIARHYGVPRGGVMTSAEARAALCWKLVRQRCRTPEFVAERLSLSKEQVVREVAAHEERILQFLATHNTA